MELRAGEVVAPHHGADRPAIAGAGQQLPGRSTAERRQRILRLLERRIWPALPARERGRRLTRAEEDEILGLGPRGV